MLSYIRVAKDRVNK